MSNLKQFRDYLATQEQSLTKKHTTYSDYMYGMYNGMQFSYSYFSGESPPYMQAPGRQNKVRHKCRK